MARRPLPSLVSAPLVLALGAVLAFAPACGGGGGEPEPPPVPTSVSPTRPPDPGPLKITVNNANDIKLRPNLVLNRGSLPTGLETKDLIVGTGRTAGPRSTVTVQYVGVIARNGQEFAASWDDGKPTSFSLTQTIKGFRNGITGMQEGGRRQIYMPANQAYGAQGNGSLVGPDEALVYIVDLITVS
jgi:peptidylprolyl isomerase